MERIEEKEDPVNPFDAIKALPLEQRIVFLLQQLDRLQKSNLTKRHPLTLMKKQELENAWRNGAVKAYKDTSQFITALFGEELRELLMKDQTIH